MYGTESGSVSGNRCPSQVASRRCQRLAGHRGEHWYEDNTARLRWGERPPSQADIEWVTSGLFLQSDFPMRRIV
jgi:hypothetical protein